MASVTPVKFILKVYRKTDIFFQIEIAIILGKHKFIFMESYVNWSSGIMEQENNS